MIGIVDPALFLSEQPGKLAPGEEERLDRLLRCVVRVHTEFRLTLPALPSYIDKLKREMLAPLQKIATTRQFQATLDYFRASLVSANLPRPEHLTIWGLKELFTWSRLDPGWLVELERTLALAINSHEPIVLLTRYVEGRNLRIHRVARCELEEKTRWRIRVQRNLADPRPVDCVRDPRNIRVPWTIRYDERLPAAEDQARYPFYPPAAWDDETTPAYRTRQSKPAWIDAGGNAWVRPATGGGYHWDVFVGNSGLAEKLGLDQLNIVQFDAPLSEGKPGHIHHVPEDKKSRLRDLGWRR